MTLEQAIEVLISRYNSGVIRSRTNDDEWRLATETAIAALRDCPENCAECGTDGANIIRHISTRGGQKMTREEAAEFTRKLVARAETIVFPKTPKTINNIPVFYFEAVLSALRGPQPDPDTGLMKCGCGGKAKIWPSDLRQAMVTDYEVGCTECAMTTGWVRGKKENAVKVWNTAMGWKGVAE